MSNADLVRATLAHRRALLAYEARAEASLIAGYDEATAPLLRRLEAYQKRLESGQPLTPQQRARAERDRARLARLVRALRADLRDRLQTRLLGVAEAEARVVHDALTGEAPDGTRIAPAVVEDLRTLILRPVQGSPWTRRLDADLVTSYDQINAGLAAAIRRGAGSEEAARLLGVAVGRIEGGRSRLRRIARTEIQRVANDTAQRIYARNVDVVGAVRYLATLDSRVCPICQPDHRTVYPLADDGSHAGPTIPRHPHCRCFYAPVVRSLRDIIARTRDRGAA